MRISTLAAFILALLHTATATATIEMNSRNKE